MRAKSPREDARSPADRRTSATPLSASEANRNAGADARWRAMRPDDDGDENGAGGTVEDADARPRAQDVGLMSPPPPNRRGLGAQGVGSPLDDLFSPPRARRTSAGGGTPARGLGTPARGVGTFGTPRFGTPRATPRGDVGRRVSGAGRRGVDEDDDGFGAPGSERRTREDPATQLTATQDVDFLMSPPPTDYDPVARDQANREEIAMQTFIWGTKVNVGDVQQRFRRFIENHEWFVLPSGFQWPEGYGESDFVFPPDFIMPPTRNYHEVMQDMHEKEQTDLDLDCQHVQKYDPYLYELLTQYPQEIIPLFDVVANEYFTQNVAIPEYADEQTAQLLVRPFNMMYAKPMRDLNPSDIDKMVCVRGMVTRCTTVIPDLKLAYFKCLMCGYAPEHVQVDRGRVHEPPLKCTECAKPGTMTLIHNQCVFANKQTVKMQETPDAIPEGETPHTVSMCVFDQLVDQAKPGDRVEVTGVYRAVPIRLSSTKRTLKSVYKTYLDVFHIRKDAGERLRNTAGQEDDEAANNSAATLKSRSGQASNQGPGQQLEFSPERLAEIQELGRSPDIYDRLVSSLAPSIWELEDVKKGLLCQLFGATNKSFSDKAANKVRGDINILLVGDPGVAKSQLLTYVHRIAPRGMYTSGRGSSAVGLTAYVTRDPESKDMVLESGALVLSDRGICCIDEFDKMSDSARSMLHEVMEQQTVSIAKAGIIAVLNARTSVLASANPVGSRYNPNMSMVENIQLPPTLLSRFDLLYLLLDRPNPETDRRLARHLVSLHYKNPPQKKRGIIDATLLTDYVSYARAFVQPVLSDEAAEELVEGYVDMRRMGGSRKVITATPRQLESLIRLSEALARMRLSTQVDRDDAKEALRLMRVAMQQSAVDPRTGTIDMDKILTGHSASDRQHRKVIADAITACLTASANGRLRLSELVKGLAERDGSMVLSVQEVRDAAMLLVEQETCSIRGDLVTLVA